MYREQFEKETDYRIEVKYFDGKLTYYYYKDASISESDYYKAYSEWLESKLKERDELLEDAKNGLNWWAENYPLGVGKDDGILIDKIEKAIA